jgi:putative intracellular protease/amidase
MHKPLAGKNIAVLVASGFEELQMTEPQKALLALGATVKLVGPESLANGWHGDSWGHYFPVDVQLSTMLSADFDMLLVPGGARSLIKLAQTPHTKRVVSAFVDDQKPVALVGDGVEILVIADRADGMTVTGAPQSKAALEGAKAVWSDEPIQLHGNVLTAKGDDVALFVSEMTNLFLGQEQVRDAA